MAENGGTTSIKRVDIEQLIKDGKIYATKADAERGNSANVNSQYFDEDNWEFDSDGRIIEIQKDGSKVVMGWANKDDLAKSTYSGSQKKSVTDDFGRQRPSDQVTYHQYDNNQSKTITDDFGGTRTVNSNDTNSNNSNANGYIETMTTVGVTAGAGGVGRTDQAMTPVNKTSSNNPYTFTDDYGRSRTVNSNDSYATQQNNNASTNGYRDTMATAGVTAGAGSVGRTDQAMTPINNNSNNVDSSKLAQEYYSTPGTNNPHKEVTSSGPAMKQVDAMQVVSYGDKVSTREPNLPNPSYVKPENQTPRRSNPSDAMQIVSTEYDAMKVVNNNSNTNNMQN